MEVWQEFFGKKIKIIFEDGQNHFSKKQGELIEITPTHLILRNGKLEAVLLQKILRVEEVQK